eukprot:TRINITY_DN18754_c0_g1_i1.p1 TRINITY_DN18754_c0_g1~~TRINITY_DN18754_c0_g1_i1.p1  ORF type:complete len:669 (+),score=184.68 TRINITY_DN18754_c0_g1_i1:112-2007(+)
MKFAHPTLVQAKAIPLIIAGKDVAAKARTGSGKTAAYAIPMIHMLLANKERDLRPGTRALVLVPTRELSEQVRSVFADLLAYAYNRLSVVNAAAVAPHQTLLSQLTGKPDIVVATPGAIVPYLSSGKMFLQSSEGPSLQFVVLDEADLLLSYGYRDDLATVASYLPKICQGILMSATLSKEVDDLKKMILHTPAVLQLEEPEVEGQMLKEYTIRVRSDIDRMLVLYVLLRLQLIEGKVLIFINGVSRCFKVKLFLERFAIKSALLNGDLPVNTRLNTIADFNSGKFNYLISTDGAAGGEQEEDSDKGEDEEEEAQPKADKEEEGVEGEVKEEKKEEEKGGEGKVKEEKPRAPRKKRVKWVSKLVTKRQLQEKSDFGVSRGIDFKRVTAVINYDLPRLPGNYVHRIGRTARGVTPGIAISFVSPSQMYRWNAITKLRTQAGAAPSEPFNLDMSILEGFRYRVGDVSASIQGSAVQQARVRALKQELLNSQKLKDHFAANPREEDMLRLKHDEKLDRVMAQPQLCDVPQYLISPEMRALPHLRLAVQRQQEADAKTSSVRAAKAAKRAAKAREKRKEKKAKNGTGGFPKRKKGQGMRRPRMAEWKRHRNEFHLPLVSPSALRQMRVRPKPQEE